MRTYEHVARAVYGRPWAILPETMGVIVALVSGRIAGEQLSDDEVRERLSAAAAANGPRRGGGQADGVAVIPLYGVIAPRAGSMAEMSGGTSVERFRGQFRDAMASSQVGAILIDCDSPGGAVDGIPEMADEIRAARGQKPVVALSNTMMASAAYWLCAGAEEVWALPSSVVGSVGVLSAHQDMSKAAEAAGVKTTLITAGKYKAEGNQWEPLGAEALAARQDMVDKVYGMFTGSVAKGRGVSVAAVRESYGQGRVMMARDALAAGMVDHVGTFDDALASAMRKCSGGTMGMGAALETHSVTASSAFVLRASEDAEDAQAAPGAVEATPDATPDDDTAAGEGAEADARAEIEIERARAEADAAR